MLFQKTRPLTNLRRLFSHKVNPNLICFKEWTPEMVIEILKSAKNLKKAVESARKPLDVLKGATVATIFELDEPVLKLAVGQAAHMLGARTSSITNKIMFDHEYMARIFSMLSDMMFVSSSTHGCVQQFAAQAAVPVVCVRSRVHQTLQALATVMAVQEEYTDLKGVRMAYVGRPAQVLNSYLLLCPMLGVNLNFICCCKEAPVHPVLFKAGTELCERSGTELVECTDRSEALSGARVVIAGPAVHNNTSKAVFQLDVSEIEKCTRKWIFIHTCPKGPEVTDELFQHKNSRTLDTIGNIRYVAAALMANSMKSHLF